MHDPVNLETKRPPANASLGHADIQIGVMIIALVLTACRSPAGSVKMGRLVNDPCDGIDRPLAKVTSQ